MTEKKSFKIIIILQNLIKKIKEFLNVIFIKGKTYNPFINRIVNTVKILAMSSRKFAIDDCFTKASSIAYTTIISLIPTLTVILTFYSIFAGVGDKKEELFKKITVFMIDHNIRLNIDPMIEAITSLIENAAKIGGIGSIIMIFSATAILRTLEKSLNDIFQVKNTRSFSNKIIYYWATLTLGPLILIAGTTLANQISTSLSSPNYNSAFITEENKLWIVGNKSKVLFSENSSLQFQTLPLENINFDTQKNYKFDSINKKFDKIEFKIEEMEFKKSEFRDIQFIDNDGWIVGKNGIMMYTNDGGKKWQINKWDSFNFNDINMLNKERGFIASDKGYLLATVNGGKNWSVLEWKDISLNLNSISFYRNHGIISGDRGLLIATSDQGKNWNLRYLDESKKNKGYRNINHVSILDEKTIILACSEGIILFSNNGGKSWKNRNFLETNYYSAFFINNSTGYITGDKGVLLYTDDSGETWHKMSLFTSKTNKIFLSNGLLWAFGDIGMIMHSSDNGRTWKGIKGKSMIVFMINFLTPFIFIWLFFLLTFIFLPNKKIPVKPAAIGAAFTGSVWVTFILLFIIYIKSFSMSTIAIYGALAAIPLFLLMLYTSSLIILYGAEVSYTLMHPQTYITIKKTAIDSKDIHLFYGISILYYIYKKFEKGEGAIHNNDLLSIASNKPEEIDYFIELFIKANLILEIEKERYTPANSSKNIKISEVIDLIHDININIPELSSLSNSLTEYLNKLFCDIKKSRGDIIGSKSLYNIIEELG